jgi:uncharacterized YigZ family protein
MNEFTIKEEVFALTEVMKSKFTAFIIPCGDVDFFKTRLEQIKKANPKARHIVYAYRIGMNSKSTDDNEPKGTAGRPLLELLHKKNLNYTAIIVVRYYGGTQLGAGRLLRTYVNSAVTAIDKAEIVSL